MSIRTKSNESLTPPPTPRDFSALVNELLNSVGWTQADLAYATGLGKNQISEWIGTSKRRVNRDDVCKIAWAIAGALDGVLVKSHQKTERIESCFSPEDKNATSSIGGLEILLGELLRSAGYSPFTDSDYIWTQKFAHPSSLDLESRLEADRVRPIKVGHLSWGPFTSKQLKNESPTILKPEFDGPLEKIIRRVCGYLGRHGVEFHSLPAYELMGKLELRELDMIAPSWLQIPWRLYDVEFSDPIPGITIGLGCLFHTSTGEVIPKNLEILVTRGGTASLQAQALLPNYRLREVDYMTQAIDLLVSDPQDQPRCYIADEVICKSHVAMNSVLSYRPLSSLTGDLFNDRYPIGFAIHKNEPELLTAINRCISLMHSNGFFSFVFDEQLRSDLHKLSLENVIDPKSLNFANNA